MLKVTQLVKGGGRIQTQATQVLTSELKFFTVSLLRVLRSTLYFSSGMILILNEVSFHFSFIAAKNMCHIQDVLCFGFTYVVI